MKTRYSRLTRFDDFRHGHAEAFFDQHHLAARDETVVYIDIDGFTDLAVEFDDGALTELQQLAHFHRGLAQHGGDRHRHIEHGFQILRAALDLCLRNAVRVEQRRSSPVRSGRSTSSDPAMSYSSGDTEFEKRRVMMAASSCSMAAWLRSA